MKILKTDWRTRLSNQALNYQMFIHMSGGDIASFDPTPAIQLLNSGVRQCRPAHLDGKTEELGNSEDELEDLEEGRDMLQNIVSKLTAFVKPGTSTGSDEPEEACKKT